MKVRRRQVSMSQTGGRLLGQGVYGCTFEPAPRCAGGKVFKTIQGLPAVGKVTTEDSAAESAAGRAIMRIPLAQQYFAAATETCRPEAQIGDPDVKSCRIITESGSRTSFSMLLMPNAGKQLLQKAADLPWLAANYERLFIHLLEGLVLLQDAGFVHNDIHMGNVLVDAAGVGRYIDFGLSYKVADLKAWEDANLGLTFRPKHIWQSPEIHAWRMRVAGMRLVDGIAQLKKNLPEYTTMEHQFPNRDTAEKGLLSLFAEDKAVARRDGVAFLKAYGPRADWWRLGICMWMLWDDLLRWTPFQNTELYKKRTRMRVALAGLTQFDPRDRISPAAALYELDPSNRLASHSLPLPPSLPLPF